NGGRRGQQAGLWRFSRAASSDRRTSDAPIGARPRTGHLARRPRLRRVLGRRASLGRMGNDRVAGNVSRGCRAAHAADQARHRRGLDPMTQRDQMDEGLGVIIRLLNEREPITVDGSWYRLRDAALHLRPLQRQIPIAVASMISPAGMKAAGKYGVGVLSVASYMQEGLTALKTQWSFAESSAKEH